VDGRMLKLDVPAVGVAQLVERWIVVPVAEGSNPSTHPKAPHPWARASRMSVRKGAYV
jgi:hypothetical protein